MSAALTIFCPLHDFRFDVSSQLVGGACNNVATFTRQTPANVDQLKHGSGLLMQPVKERFRYASRNQHTMPLRPSVKSVIKLI
jgi:hypothetical protein